MHYKVFFQPEATAQVLTAYSWYEEQRFGLGVELLGEIDIAVEKLAENPLRFSFINSSYRHVKTTRFPYLLVYKVDENNVYILYVRHVKQKPL